MADSKNVFFIFLMYSAAMLALPLCTFFGVQNLLEKEFHIIGFANTAWSVISTVIMVNIIIMVYVWRAYKQEIEEEMETTDKLKKQSGEIPSLSQGSLDTKKRN